MLCVLKEHKRYVSDWVQNMVFQVSRPNYSIPLSPNQYQEMAPRLKDLKKQEKMMTLLAPNVLFEMEY